MSNQTENNNNCKHKAQSERANIQTNQLSEKDKYEQYYLLLIYDAAAKSSSPSQSPMEFPLSELYSRLRNLKLSSTLRDRLRELVNSSVR